MLRKHETHDGKDWAICLDFVRNAFLIKQLPDLLQHQFGGHIVHGPRVVLLANPLEVCRNEFLAPLAIVTATLRKVRCVPFRATSMTSGFFSRLWDVLDFDDTGCRVQYYCLQYLESILKVYIILSAYYSA